MSTVRTWEVHRPGWKHPECVKAVSGEQACDMVSRVCGIPRHELIAHPREPREGGGVMSERHSDPKERERRRSLAAEVLAHLSGSQIDDLAMVLVQAYLSGQTPQQAAVDAAAFIDQCDTIPDGGPTPADLRGEEIHD